MATDSAKLDVIRLLAAKVETTTGTAIAVTGTDATYIIMNPQMTPDQPLNEREAMAGKGQLQGSAGAQSGKLTFEVELSGSGSSGGVPDWATVFLPACDFTNSAGTFARTNNVTTLTMVLYEDGLKRTLSGAKGTFKLTLVSGKPGRLAFEFTGRYEDEADAAILSPTFPTVLAPVFKGATCTIGGYTPKISTFEFDAGNTVIMREDATDATGYHAAAIPQHKATFTLDPETDSIANRDWFTKYKGSSEEAVNVVVGATANNTITLAATKAQTTKSPRGSRNGLMTNQIAGQFNGTTDFSIAFS